EGIVVSWTPIPHPTAVSGLRYLYRIYRREENSKADAIAGELALDSASGARFVDHNFASEQRYSYHATVVTLINRAPGPVAEVEGDDTPQVSVFTHDVFPPAVPSGLQAAFTSEDKHSFIDLIWNPDTESDLAGYNVFRRESDGRPLKINSDLVKLPAFRDQGVSAGKKYYYSVSAVDIRGNESARSEEANETVP
ncbi:MAG TPA: fibronectin type III domain-containing protein, partial [Candidatus Acidoferrum sp.]